MKVRIHRDIPLRWHIKMYGQYVDLAAMDLSLSVRDALGVTQPVQFTTDGSYVVATFWGVDQKSIGRHVFTLYLNRGEHGQDVIDACDALELVAETCQEDGEHGCGEFVISPLEIEGEFGLGGVPDAPVDGKKYGRKDARWEEIDAYTKDETDTLLEEKADKSTTYTKTEVDNALAG